MSKKVYEEARWEPARPDPSSRERCQVTPGLSLSSGNVSAAGPCGEAVEDSSPHPFPRASMWPSPRRSTSEGHSAHLQSCWILESGAVHSRNPESRERHRTLSLKQVPCLHGHPPAAARPQGRCERSLGRSSDAPWPGAQPSVGLEETASAQLSTLQALSSLSSESSCGHERSFWWNSKNWHEGYEFSPCF